MKSQAMSGRLEGNLIAISEVARTMGEIVSCMGQPAAITAAKGFKPRPIEATLRLCNAAWVKTRVDADKELARMQATGWRLVPAIYQTIA